MSNMYCFFNALQEKFEPQTKIGPLAPSSWAPEGCPNRRLASLTSKVFTTLDTYHFLTNILLHILWIA